MGPLLPQSGDAQGEQDEGLPVCTLVPAASAPPGASGSQDMQLACRGLRVLSLMAAPELCDLR